MFSLGFGLATADYALTVFVRDRCISERSTTFTILAAMHVHSALNVRHESSSCSWETESFFHALKIVKNTSINIILNNLFAFLLNYFYYLWFESSFYNKNKPHHDDDTLSWNCITFLIDFNCWFLCDIEPIRNIIYVFWWKYSKLEFDPSTLGSTAI